MNQQTKDTTAMQELIEYMDEHSMQHTGTYKKAKSLLQKEREQIEKAFDYWDNPTGMKPEKMYGSDYFTQTYKQ